MSGSESTPVDGEPERLPERLADVAGENLVVTGPPMAGKSELVVETVSSGSTDGRDALVITTTRSAPRLLDGRVSGDGRLGVIDCTPGESRDVGDKTTTVGSPGDLTGISMPVSKFIESVDSRPVVVLDSISSLLMYADKAAVFRFLSVLTTQVRRNDGLGLYTIEEGSHEEQTTRTFAQLFDGQIDVRDAGRREGKVDGIPDVAEEWVPY